MSSEATRVIDVAIIGAGPVGLVTAHLLGQLGLEVMVFEQEHIRSPHSRAIGIHPVSLEVLEPLGLAAPLVAAGVKVSGGRAMKTMDCELGSLSMDRLALPFPFVLSLPQQQTEEILEQQLRRWENVSLHRGYRLVGLEPGDPHMGLTLRRVGEAQRLDVRCHLTVGCDGKDSSSRRLADIRYSGAPYPDRFLMGDFADNTPFGSDGAIFLHPAGLIESFPLPAKQRRWVVRVDRETDRPLVQQLALHVKQRVGHSLAQVPAFMLSRFGVQHYLADEFYRGRLVLAGDAAHVLSPIGGQGMNIGILDAARLQAGLAHYGREAFEQDVLATVLHRYQEQGKAIARRATRRSALFMYLGKRRARPALRDAAIKALLSGPLAHVSAKLFTMRGLRWI